MKFRLEWDSNDDARVIANDGTVVGGLHWEYLSSGWLFERYDVQGDPLGMEMIEIDHDQRMTFVRERQEVARLDEATRPAIVAELEGRQRMFRDESKDLASLGARVKARQWYETLACTGTTDPDTGLLSHDGDTCPIHES